MVITFTPFRKYALNDVERIIDDYSKGSNFVIDTSAPYEEVEALIGTDDIYNIKFNFAYESFITTSGTINDESVSNGRIIIQKSIDEKEKYGVDADAIDENKIAISSVLAYKLGVSVGDKIKFTIFPNGKATDFEVSVIIERSENSPDYLLNYGGMSRLLINNGLSDSYNITFFSNEYESCRSVIETLKENGYSATSSLYDSIYENTHIIYLTFSGLIAMSAVLGIAVVFIFVSFFMIILTKRKNFIALLIHSGMRLKRIVFLYWLIIESIHIIISLASLPFSIFMIKWISNEYYSTFEIKYSNIHLDIIYTAMIFCIVFCVLGISMLFFSKNLKKINYSIISLKERIL